MEKARGRIPKVNQRKIKLFLRCVPNMHINILGAFKGAYFNQHTDKRLAGRNQKLYHGYLWVMIS